MELEVVKFIKAFGLTQLSIEYGIIVGRDMEAAPNLVCLNYDQIASPKSHPITQECRGLILNTHTLEVVSRSFDRFYNYGEVPEQTKQVDFSRAVVYEKLDGSLLNCYHDGKCWNIATRGNTTGRNAIAKSRHSYHHLVCLALDVDVSDMNPLVDENENWLDMKRYNEYVWRINKKLDKVLVKACTYITELVSPHINIVTQYSETVVYILASRHIKSGEFVSCIQNEAICFKLPRVYTINSLADVELVVRIMSKGDILREGVVVFDPINGVRTKIKNTVYLKAHRSISRNIDAKTISELVAENEEDEYLTYFPQHTELFEPFITCRNQIVATVDELLKIANGCIAAGYTINDVAKWLKDEPLSGFVFPAINRKIPSGLQAFAAAKPGGRLNAVQKCEAFVMMQAQEAAERAAKDAERGAKRL